jgi:hypothetical protein
MPSCPNSTPPPPPPEPPWTIARVQTAALEEMGCCLLFMSDDLEALNRRALLLLPSEPELTAMLEGEIPPTLAVEVQVCIECIANDYLPLTIEAMQHAATARVAMLERDWRSHARGGAHDLQPAHRLPSRLRLAPYPPTHKPARSSATSSTCPPMSRSLPKRCSSAFTAEPISPLSSPLACSTNRCKSRGGTTCRCG